MSEGSPTEAFGPYLVYEQLGVGGMAQVHRAVATTSEFRRPVALKRMLSHIAGSEEMVKSFVREARLASYLRHENVAQTYDLGRVGEIYFIVMELITGRNLREVLRHCGATTGPMPVQIALNILNQICDALDYAHNLSDETGQPLGIIHRDVSPSNVIVSDSGVVKLIDFGIAKASAVGMQTMGRTLKGKFAYMAPEYIAGRIDARADLFAVGVIAHELLTNRPLFSGCDDIDTLTRVRDMHIEPPSKKNRQVPPEIDDIVMTALQRDPDRRWQHATALRSALTTLTKRLGLVATNTQVIQWLDWAFAQPAPPRGASLSDTEPDGDPLSDDPSISIEQLTVEIGSMSKRVTRVAADRGPEPPTRPALGTPAHAGPGPSARDPRAPRATTSGVAPATASSPSPGRVSASTPPTASPPRPRTASSSPIASRPHQPTPSPAPIVPPRPRTASSSPPVAAQPRAPNPSSSPVAAQPRPRTASSSPPVAAQPRAPNPSSSPVAAQPRPRTASSSPPLAAQPRAPNASSPVAAQPRAPASGPVAAPTHRTQPASVPPPIAATARSRPASGSAPVATTARPRPSSVPAPLGSPVPTSSTPLPVMPGLNAAPFAAPRPSALGSIQLPLDPERSARVQREIAAAVPEAATTQRSPALLVILVVLAAAVAATTVYFVLPLLT